MISNHINHSYEIILMSISNHYHFFQQFNH